MHVHTENPSVLLERAKFDKFNLRVISVFYLLIAKILFGKIRGILQTLVRQLGSCNSKKCTQRTHILRYLFRVLIGSFVCISAVIGQSMTVVRVIPFLLVSMQGLLKYFRPNRMPFKGFGIFALLLCFLGLKGVTSCIDDSDCLELESCCSDGTCGVSCDDCSDDSQCSVGQCCDSGGYCVPEGDCTSNAGAIEKIVFGSLSVVAIIVGYLVYRYCDCCQDSRGCYLFRRRLVNVKQPGYETFGSTTTQSQQSDIQQAPSSGNNLPPAGFNPLPTEVHDQSPAH